MPDSIWPDAIIRMLSTEPCVACATATSPGTPQLPPRSQGGAPGGLEIAPAMTPAISKKLPPVPAAPMRKNCASGASAAAAAVASASIRPTARPKPRRRRPEAHDIVSPGETNILAHTPRITPDCNTPPPFPRA